MKFRVSPPTVRAKAVWGPRRILAAVVLVAVSFGVAPSASAEGWHRRQAPRLRAGVPNRFVKYDKMDSDVARRAGGINRYATADVIVTLEDGADLPYAFQRYSHNGKLSVIHG